MGTYISTFAGTQLLHDSPNRFRKLCWAIVIILALIICLFNINNLIKQFLLIPIVVTISGWNSNYSILNLIINLKTLIYIQNVQC